MNKTLKKYLSCVMALTLSLSLFGCSKTEETVSDPKTVLEDAQKKMNELDSMSLTADINLSMDAGEEDSSNMSIKIPMSMTIDLAGLKGDLIYHTNVKAEIFGIEIETDQTYFDGMLYSETEGEKTAMLMELADAKQMASAGKINMTFDNMKAVKEGNKTIITIKPSETEIKELMKTMGNISDSLFDEDELDALSSVKADDLIIVINSDGYVESEEFGLKAEAEGATVTCTLKFTMSGFNSTTVEKVDPSEYQNVNDMFDFDDFDLDE